MPSVLNLESSRPTLIFRQLERRFRSKVSRVKTWRTWQGTPADNDPPTADLCPWVRLTPSPAGDGARDNISQRGRLVVRVELVTRGTCIDDMLDLWALFEEACFPYDQTESNELRDVFRPLGSTGTDWKITNPAVAVEASAEEALMRGTAEIEIQYRIQG
jgi:hypothetical protein